MAHEAIAAEKWECTVQSHKAGDDLGKPTNVLILS